MLTSCALLKRNSRTSNKTEQETNSVTRLATTSEIKNITNANEVVYQKDSIQAGYSIWFWPKGKFSFLPTGGVTGEFDSVLLKGNLQQIRKSTQTVAVQQAQKENTQATGLANSRSSATTKETVRQSIPEVKLIVIGFIVLALLLIYIFRR
ncbi:hypothetical protein [Pedobacter sp. L105]|uniref:hypothetical protein n=1 Tax=Pedobacter sp. L105 TaxID=1641871 RepID=UPI00131D26EC|nr:hypothetical protein [Pedobacter sp. L105]